MTKEGVRYITHKELAQMVKKRKQEKRLYPRSSMQAFLDQKLEELVMRQRLHDELERRVNG